MTMRRARPSFDSSRSHPRNHTIRLFLLQILFLVSSSERFLECEAWKQPCFVSPQHYVSRRWRCPKRRYSPFFSSMDGNHEEKSSKLLTDDILQESAVNNENNTYNYKDNNLAPSPYGVPVALNEHESTNFGLGDIMSLSPSTMSNGLASTSKLTLDGLSKEMDAMVKENKNATTANDAALGGGLVTCTRGTLGDRFASLQLTPLERIALTANGNLQRIYSSYYDAPVHVSVERSEARTATSSEDESISESSKSRTWDRVVHLSVFSQLFCTAESTIVVHDDHCLELLQSGRVGIGQLFRHLDRLPTFTLLDAGRSPNSHNGSLWRVYTLDCQELSCHIRETFCPDSWSLSPLLPSPTEDSNDDFLPQ